MRQRQRHTGLFEDLLESVSRLPGWLNGLLALGAFLLLRRVEGPPVLRTAVRFAGVIVPLVFIAGAAMRVVRARRRREPWEDE
ncbi:MAG: hypothetical protein NAOJABEB_02837 [Steroidobacteraceae bacterium]|nr:hypothetical protein [Steroidobacteraceae bacterium]